MNIKKHCENTIEKLKKTRTDAVYTEKDRDAAIKMFEWLKTATPEEICEISVMAGVHNDDGTLTEKYGGKKK